MDLHADSTPRVIAHFYNKNIGANGGKLEAMAFTKGNEDPRAIAVNVESRVPEGIKRDQPWQSENGLGEWYYRAGTFYDTGIVITASESLGRQEFVLGYKSFEPIGPGTTPPNNDNLNAFSLFLQPMNRFMLMHLSPMLLCSFDEMP